VIAFNPGLVLYSDWRLSVSKLAKKVVPIVFTQYRNWESDTEKKLISAIDAFNVMLGK